MLVVGDKEQEAGSAALRHRAEGDLGALPLADIIAKLRAEIEEKRF